MALGAVVARIGARPCDPLLLARVKHTKSQVGLTRAQRQQNLQGAFRVPAGATARLKDRRVLLVLAITLHNIPEGLAIGVSFGGAAAGLSQATLGGAIALAVAGFSWGGWVTGATARQMAADQSRTDVVNALSLICVDQSKRDPQMIERVAALKAASSWTRGDERSSRTPTPRRICCAGCRSMTRRGQPKPLVERLPEGTEENAEMDEAPAQ